MNLVMACLGIMGKGMVGIFAVILVIWGLVALLNKLSSPKKTAAPAVAAAPAAAVSVTDDAKRGELIAAVSAALAEELGEDVTAIRILSFKKIG